jgi:hypothetical protein
MAVRRACGMNMNQGRRRFFLKKTGNGKSKKMGKGEKKAGKREIYNVQQN